MPDLKVRLLRYLDFPGEWVDFDLYPNSLLELQLKAVLEDRGMDERQFNELQGDSRYGAGSDHFRAAAIFHLLSKDLDSSAIANLRKAVEKDPHQRMSRWILRDKKFME